MSAATSQDESLAPSTNTIINQKDGSVNGIAAAEQAGDVTDKKSNTSTLFPKNLKNEQYRDMARGEKETVSGESSFADTIKGTAVLSDETKKIILDDKTVREYEVITNKESLKAAAIKLRMEGQDAINEWNRKGITNFDDIDVALGYLLIEKYQMEQNSKELIAVTRKMRKAATKSGQAVQAYAILGRMTPEGMIMYAQSELDEFYEQYVSGKSGAWVVNKKRAKYELTQSEINTIHEKMTEVAKLDSSNPEQLLQKIILLNDVQKILQNKVPSTIGEKLKTWQRISLLFNGKTQLRNVLGNAFMVPIANIVDTVGTPIDFMLSKKSGVRTTGLPQYRAGAKGAWRGIKNALFNFNNDIDSRALSGDKFDIGRGNAFNPAYAKNGVTKKMFAALNMVDRVNSFLLDIGDRAFFQAYFDNSIANQLRLNKTQDITPEMIEVAQYEALERTWQDNNGVTRALKKMQDFFNGGKDFGFGNI
ncbi:MAG: hypothetical protein RSB97_08185, partial [Christensenella sp.]